MTKSVYVTGCLGFIGSYVTRACLKKGWYVKGIDKMTYAARPELLDEFNTYSNFSFHKEDIVDLQWIYECDYIINTAAESHVDNSIASSDEFLHSNVLGVHNILELMRRKKKEDMPTLLHFSTDEVYGDVEEGSHSETDLLKPSNPYSATKAAADQLVLAWNRTYGLPYIIVRVQQIIKLSDKNYHIYLDDGVPYAENYDEYIDLSFNRQGQDVRYSINDTKLKNLGWNPTKVFKDELSEIVNYYTENFIW